MTISEGKGPIFIFSFYSPSLCPIEQIRSKIKAFSRRRKTHFKELLDDAIVFTFTCFSPCEAYVAFTTINVPFVKYNGC